MHNAHKTFGGFGLSVDLIMRALVALIFLFNWSHGFRTKVYQISNLSEFSIHAKLSTLSDLQCSFYCFHDYACEGFEFNQTTCSILKDIVVDSEAESQAWVNSVLSSKLITNFFEKISIFIFFLGDCYTYGRYYSGSTLFALNTFNALVCQEECFKHDDCNFWTFDKSSTICQLRATKVLGNLLTDYISGPKQC